MREGERLCAWSDCCPLESVVDSLLCSQVIFVLGTDEKLPPKSWCVHTIQNRCKVHIETDFHFSYGSGSNDGSGSTNSSDNGVESNGLAKWVTMFLLLFWIKSFQIRITTQQWIRAHLTFHIRSNYNVSFVVVFVISFNEDPKKLPRLLIFLWLHARQVLFYFMFSVFCCCLSSFLFYFGVFFVCSDSLILVCQKIQIEFGS